MRTLKRFFRRLFRAVVDFLSKVPLVSHWVSPRASVAFATWGRHISPESLPEDVGPNGFYLKLREAEHYRRHPCQIHVPCQSGKIDCEQELYKCGFDVSTQEVFLSCVPNARLLGRWFLILTPDGRVFQDSAATPKLLDRSNIHYRRRLPRLTHKYGAHLLLGVHWAHTYFHWIIDVLPRLSILDMYPQLKSLPMVLPNNVPPAFIKTLEILDIRQENLVPIGQEQFQFDKLYYPSVLSPPGPAGQISPWAVSWLRNKFLGHLPPTSEPSGRYYITRRDAKKRRLLNEEEFLPRLESEGFELICPGDLSVIEQVRLFSGASIIIGPHGAGLTNMVFAPTSATLIELFPGDYFNGCYWTLTSTLDQHYGCIAGPASRRQDFTIPAEKILFALDRIAKRSDLPRVPMAPE